MNLLKKIIAIATIGIMMAGPAMGTTVAELQAQIDTLLATLATLQAELAELSGEEAVTVEGCTITSFDRALSVGMSGDDVNCLQIVLNSDSDTQLAESGVGSPGEETSYFGPLTKAAVIKFQEKYAEDVLESWGLTEGTGYVGSTTRAKLNTLLVAAEEEEDEDEELPPVSEPTASLAADTPVAATIPSSASKVPLLKVILQAADEDVTVTGMTFRRTGVGKYTDWVYVYVYVDGARVTSYGRTISSDAHEVEFPTLSISIPAGSSRSVTLRADSTTATTEAGNQSTFQLTSITSAASFTGLPITGNTMTIGGVGVSSVALVSGPGISNPVLGTEGAEIGTFKVTAGDQDVEIRQVILTIVGTIARANVTNIKLYFENELLAETAGVDSYDNATLSLDEPYSIAKTLIRTFTVKADLGGRVNENLTTKIQEAGDLFVVDKVYDYGAVVTGSFPLTLGNQITLKGGTLSMADQGPLADKVAKNNRDVVLTKIGLTGSRDLEVIKLKVSLSASGDIIDGDDTTLITDLRLKDVDTGSTLMTGTLPTATTNAASVTMTGSFNLTANLTRNVAITVDMGTGAGLNDKTIAADLEMEEYSTGYVYIRDVVTGDYVADTEVVPPKVSGDNQEIVAVSLALLLASSPISETAITGATNVPATGLLFTTGGGSAITIRTITAKVNVSQTSSFTAGNTTTTRDKVLVAKLYDGAALLSQKVLEEKGVAGVAAYGEAKFDQLNVPIAKNSGKSLVIKIDTASNLTIAYYVTASVGILDVDARDPDNNQILTGGTGANVLTLGTPPSRYVTIDTAGTLSLAEKVADSPLSDNIAVGGAADGKPDVVLLAIEFTGTKEDIKVKEITLEETGTSDDRAYTTAWIYDGASMAGFAAFPAGSTSTIFKNLSVIVPANAKKVLTIRADLAGIDGTFVVSGSSTKVKVATTTITAVGVSSGTTIPCLGSDVESADQYVYKTAVEVAVSTDTPAGTKTPSTLQDVLHLDFINEGTYDATLGDTTLTIAYSAGSGGVTTTSERGFKIYTTGGTLVGSATSSGMTTLINGATIAFSSLDWTLPSGATTKLILKGDTTYAVTGGGVYQSFDVSAVSDVVWNDSYIDVSARHFVAPLVGGTLSYGY